MIEVHTASFRTIRGYSCGICLNDEECFWVADEESAEPASEIIAAERPSLITIPFSILLSLSSPHARRGPMYEAMRDHFGNDDSPVLFWKATSLEMNPSLRSRDRQRGVRARSGRGGCRIWRGVSKRLRKLHIARGD